jgi:uncharacterized membrane protein (UPF0136 family)
MMNLELSGFDQTTILFLVFGALGLVRERRALPFVLMLAGCLFQGSLAVVMVAALIVWHRLDRASSRWIQLKDFFGLMLVIGGTIAPDVMHSFFSFFGVLMIAVNFGGGLLGTLPALVLLRQYYPHPEYLEVALAGVGIYWVVAEILRFTKSKHQGPVLSILEGLGSLVALINFRSDIEKWAADPILLGLGSAIVLLIVTLFILVRYRGFRFFEMYQASRNKAIRMLTAGGRLINGFEPWARASPEHVNLEFKRNLDQAVFLIAGIIIFIGAFILIQKGGF